MAARGSVPGHPLSEDFGGDFLVVQYADDTLLILPTKARTLFNLKGILISFSNSTCLHVNFNKSFLVPINVEDTQAKHLAETFGCKVGTMPFTYLGSPLGTTRPSLQEFTPLLSRMEGRLGGISKFQIPFNYLGLPLGTTRPSLQEFNPLLSRIEGRLGGINKFISYHGRFILVNSVF